MRLDSTGLGIGGSPVNPLTVFAAASAKAPALLLGTVGSPTYGWDFSVDGATNGNLFIRRLVASVKTDVLEFDRSSGNVGVGVTPSAWSTTFGLKATQVYNSALASNGTSGYLTNNAYYAGAGYTPTYINASLTPAQAIVFNSTGVNDIQFLIGAAGTAGNTIAGFATAAMTLDASGNLLVGTTSQLQAQNSRINFAGDFYNLNGVSLKTTNGGSGSQFIGFINESGAVIGSVNRNGATNAVNYNTSSDYRLKESVAPLNGGLARVNSLKPSTYKWKSNGSDGEGFLAHELAEVIPFAVTGDKDAVHKDGSIKSQGIDMSRIVPILVAAIQELTARVQTLEAR